MSNGIDYFKLHREWFEFYDGNKEIVTAKHTQLYFWIIQLANMLHWPKVIGLPTDRTMTMADCKTYKTYKKALDDLIEWKKIILVSKSYNVHTCNRVTLVINTKAQSETDEVTLVKNTNVEPKQPQKTREKLPMLNHHKKTLKDSIRRVKTKEPVKPSPPELDFIQLIIEEFKKVFTDYVITTPGKEKASAGNLLAVFKKQYPDLGSDEMLKKLRGHFDACKNIPDKWYRTNMTLSLMVVKYNEINNILSNPGPGTSPDLSKVDKEKYLNEE